MAELSTISESQILVSQELNNQILAVLSNQVQGFQKAFVMASAIQVLKDKLTPEYMKPIMALQGVRLGFKTDKDKSGGYPLEDVKLCLIDAVLLGLQPTGNEFNIIAGNMYPTKEGFGSLLKLISGLSYNLNFSNPIISVDKSSANCTVKVNWKLNDKENSQSVDFQIKSNAYATADAIIGKATRKARAWLFNYISGTEITDGDVTDINHEVISSKTLNTKEISENKESSRIIEHISKSKTTEQLKKCDSAIKSTDTELKELYLSKEIELCDDLTLIAGLGKRIAPENFELLTLFDDKKRELEKK